MRPRLGLGLGRPVIRLRQAFRARIVGSSPIPDTVRRDVALRYLRGSGIEIGALNRPMRVPSSVGVRYVDHERRDSLIARYPEFAGQPIVEPDILDDGATLVTLPDGSEDFVIANHVIEHLENPVGALRAWLRVLRPGGVIFMCVPEKRRTFDAERPSTQVEHLLRDDADGPQWSRRSHYEEWARLAEHVPEADVPERVAQLEGQSRDVHFHVWAFEDIAATLVALRDGPNGLPFDIELLQANWNETICVLRRVA